MSSPDSRLLTSGGWAFCATNPRPNAEDGDDVTGGGGSASGIELFDQQTRKKMFQTIADGHMEGNGRVINPKTPLDPIRVTPEEAAALQSYPDGFVWEGPKTKRYLQIGNAVPPLLAQHVLSALWAPAPAVAAVVALPLPVESELDAAA